MRRRSGQEPSTPRRRSARRRTGVSALRVIVCFAVGFSLAAGVTAARGWRAADRSPHFRRAAELVAAERYPEALEEYRKAARDAPADPRPPHRIGEVYRNLVLDERAEQSFRKAVRLDAEFRPARVSLAVVLHELGKNREAIELLEKLREETADDPLLWAELAINWMRLGEPERAIGLLERYNAAEGRQAWGHAHLGRAQADAGNDAEAEKAYRRALEIDPRLAKCRLWLGQLLIATHRLPEARGMLDSFHQLRQLQTREHVLKMALLRESNNVNALVELARTRHRLGKTREALVPLRRAMELLPGDEQLRKLQEALLREGEKARERLPER